MESSVENEYEVLTVESTSELKAVSLTLFTHKYKFEFWIMAHVFFPRWKLNKHTELS